MGQKSTVLCSASGYSILSVRGATRRSFIVLVYNPTVTNPNQVLKRFTDQMNFSNLEFYKMDTYNLRGLSLTLNGLQATSIAITIAIREVSHSDAKPHAFYPSHYYL